LSENFDNLEKVKQEEEVTKGEFAQILQDSKLLSKIKSSKKFWSQNEEKFPYMSKLFALTSINSSSAFIERFFSICGIINTDRNENMKHELNKQTQKQYKKSAK